MTTPATQELNTNHIPISTDLLKEACKKTTRKFEDIPFKHRGISITRELIKACMEILNVADDKTLPQNCRNAVKSKTPDGLDRRIKEKLNTNLRTANIISDVLEKAKIVEILNVRNPNTGRMVKRTKLLNEWTW